MKNNNKTMKYALIHHAESVDGYEEVNEVIATSTNKEKLIAKLREKVLRLKITSKDLPHL